MDDQSGRNEPRWKEDEVIFNVTNLLKILSEYWWKEKKLGKKMKTQIQY